MSSDNDYDPTIEVRYKHDSLNFVLAVDAACRPKIFVDHLVSLSDMPFARCTGGIDEPIRPCYFQSSAGRKRRRD